MKHILLPLLILIMLCENGMAQTKGYFNVQKIYKNGLVSFYNKKAKAAAQKINEYIQLTTVHYKMNNYNDTAIEKMWTVNEHINNKRILSLSISNSTGEARHYVFNAATGSVIDIQEFIHTSGISYIRKRIIAALNPKAGPEAMEEQATDFIKCLKEDIHQFKLTQDSLVIYSNNCNNFGVKPASDRVAFESKTLAKYLSNYGQAMFGLDKKLKIKKMVTNVTNGLYYGKEGMEDITMQLDQPYNKHIRGIVYYPKTNKAYPLEGTFKNNKLETTLRGKQYRFIISAGQIQGEIKEGRKTVQHLSLQKQ
jgi:hypothetical protein